MPSKHILHIWQRSQPNTLGKLARAWDNDAGEIGVIAAARFALNDLPPEYYILAAMRRSDGQLALRQYTPQEDAQPFHDGQLWADIAGMREIPLDQREITYAASVARTFSPDTGLVHATTRQIEKLRMILDDIVWSAGGSHALQKHLDRAVARWDRQNP